MWFDISFKDCAVKDIPFRFVLLLGVLTIASLVVSGCNSSSSSSSSSSSTTVTTTTALTVSSTSTTTGKSITLTATISPSAATGTVTFYNGSTLLGSATLSSGAASITTSFASAGTYSITATYGGSSTYGASTSAATSVTISTALSSTTTTLAASSTSAPYGSSIIFTATVLPSAATGAVVFYDGSTELGSSALSSGQATYTSSALAAGSHSITASYEGSTSYAASASDAVAVTVTASGESWNINTGSNSADLIENTEFAYTIKIDLSSLSVTSDAGAISIDNLADSASIALNGTTVATVTQDSTLGLTIDSAFPEGTYVEYVLSGSYSKCVTVYSIAKFKLTLNGATIASTNGPAINIQSEQRAFVVLPSDTQTTLTDTSTYSTRYLSSGDKMDIKAAFFSEGPLIFSGDGSLNITSTAKHALCSDKHVRLRSGTFSLTSNAKNGIHTNNAFVMDGGTLTITTPSGAGKGIKVEGKENSAQPLGFIAINDGTITINTYDKAISASWEAADDAETTSTDDDPDPRVTVNGGTISITTFGVPVEDELSPEGIESKSLLTINAGTITVSTTDDGLNAGTGMVINGGRIYAVSSKNDAVDSNGYLTINGGLLVARGSAAPEAGLDCDANTFTVTGGTFIGLGGSTSNPTTSVSKQNSVILQNLATTGLLGIKDTSGNVAFAYQVPDTSSTILLSSSSLTTGTSYTVYTGGTLTLWDEEFHGLYLNPVGYSGGSSRTTFSVSTPLTTVRF
jgi:hypothetical protein